MQPFSTISKWIGCVSRSLPRVPSAPGTVARPGWVLPIVLALVLMDLHKQNPSARTNDSAGPHGGKGYTQEPGALLKDGRGLLYLGVRGGASKGVSLSRDLSDKHS